MKEIKSKICEWPGCGREFTPSAHSAHNQRYCTRASCVAERNMERQRKYREKKENDPNWRIQRARLVAEYAERKLKREAEAAKTSVDKELSRNFETSTTKVIVAGIASFISNASTPETLREFLAKMKVKGRKLLGPCAGFGKLID